MQRFPRGERRYPVGDRGMQLGARLVWAALLIAIAVGMRLGAGGLGRTSTARIVGGSMEPTLHGPRWRVACPACGNRVEAVWFADRAPEPARCDQCGTDVAIDQATPVPSDLVPSDLVPSDLVPGDVVVIDRMAYRFVEPRRGDMVVVGWPEASGQGPPEVKRLLGFSGERLSFQQGDVWIDGVRWQKSMDLLRSMAIEVVRARDQRHWTTIPRDGGVRYRYDHRAWLNQPPTKVRDWKGLTSIERRLQPSPILDDYSCNHADVRTLQPADDLLIDVAIIPRHAMAAATSGGSVADNTSSDTTHSPHRRIAIQLWYRRAAYPFVIAWSPTRMTWKLGDQVLGDQVLGVASPPPAMEFSIACCDGRLLMEVGGVSTAVSIEAVAKLTGEAIAVRDDRPIAIDVEGEWERPRVRVYRDLVYSLDGDMGLAWQSDPVAAGRYFVVGDNIPMSIDSRDHPSGAVVLGQIVGGQQREGLAESR
jgi:signal peptidase I